jgi:hypothetical protein
MKFIIILLRGIVILKREIIKTLNILEKKIKYEKPLLSTIINKLILKHQSVFDNILITIKSILSFYCTA